MYVCIQLLDFPCGHRGKELTCQCGRHKRHAFSPWVGKITWRRAWQPTPAFFFFLNNIIYLFILALLGLHWRRQWHPTPILLPGVGCHRLLRGRNWSPLKSCPLEMCVKWGSKAWFPIFSLRYTLRKSETFTFNRKKSFLSHKRNKKFPLKLWFLSSLYVYVISLLFGCWGQ